MFINLNPISVNFLGLKALDYSCRPVDAKPSSSLHKNTHFNAGLSAQCLDYQHMACSRLLKKSKLI